MANWLRLDALREWDFPPLPFFQYDQVTDEQIARALSDTTNLASVDPQLDWEDDRWLSRAKHIPEDLKHTYRTAALVRDLTSGHVLREAILLDTFSGGACGCCITNGHHRIRALQYLNVPAAPFALQGLLDPLEDLVRLAGTAPNGSWVALFAPHLLVPAEDDVLLP